MGKARDFIPALKFGHKIMPEDMAGMMGLPYVGNIWYVDPNAGSDTANSGTSQNDALATVKAAYDKCTSGKHDVVFIVPTGGTGRTTEAAAITWAKRFTHLVGMAAPTTMTPRAGMNFTLTAATTTFQFVVTENGCIFKNVVFNQGVADSYALVHVNGGDYNYFEGCHFSGIANATAADSANARCVKLTGVGETVFNDCTFGVDSVASTAANNLLEIGAVGNGSARNIFNHCRFLRLADAAAPFFVSIGDEGDIDRFVLFDHCLFHNAVHSGATTMTVGIDCTANLGGSVILWDSWMVGVTDLSDSFTSLEVIGAMTQPTASDAGLSITPS